MCGLEERVSSLVCCWRAIFMRGKDVTRVFAHEIVPYVTKFGAPCDKDASCEYLWYGVNELV